MDFNFLKDLRYDMLKYVPPPPIATVRFVDRPKPPRLMPLMSETPETDQNTVSAYTGGRGLVRNDKNQIVDVRGNPLDPKLLRGRTKTKELEELKQTVVLSPLQRDAIVGSLLGDGHLESQTNGRTYHLRIEQSKKKGSVFDASL